MKQKYFMYSTYICTLDTRVQQETALYAVLDKNGVTNWPASFSIEEALFCCCGRIEIKYFFSWLFMTHRLHYFKQHFSTSEIWNIAFRFISFKSSLKQISFWKQFICRQISKRCQVCKMPSKAFPAPCVCQRIDNILFGSSQGCCRICKELVFPEDNEAEI